MQILYNSCKNTSCKILHATHANKAQQELNKADENCEIKQQFLRTVTFIFVTENKKIYFYGGATTNYKKIKVWGITYFT